MSGLLFLADVIAFVIVVAWAYANNGAGAAGENGLLGMKPPASGASAGAKRAEPSWRRAAAGRGAPPVAAQDERPTPGWRRRLAQRPPWA